MARTLIERWLGEDGSQSIAVIYDEETARYVVEEAGVEVAGHTELTFVRLWLLGDRGWIEGDAGVEVDATSASSTPE